MPRRFLLRFDHAATVAVRALLIMLALVVPVLAVPGANGGPGRTIEAPALKKSGAGLVLLVSLQRG